MFSFRIKDQVTKYPEGVTHIVSSCNLKLRYLPPLPEGLIELRVPYCDNLEYIPSLPSTLKILNCFKCNLKELPLLPEGLRELHFGMQYFTKLPPFPKSLRKMVCYHCFFLTSLPRLPKDLSELVVEGCEQLCLDRRRYKKLKDYKTAWNKHHDRTEERDSKERIQERTLIFKEEMMKFVWNPFSYYGAELVKMEFENSEKE